MCEPIRVADQILTQSPVRTVPVTPIIIIIIPIFLENYLISLPNSSCGLLIPVPIKTYLYKHVPFETNKYKSYFSLQSTDCCSGSYYVCMFVLTYYFRGRNKCQQRPAKS